MTDWAGDEDAIERAIDAACSGVMGWDARDRLIAETAARAAYANRPTIKDRLRKLEGLYEATEEDWVLTISHCLTEPGCPSVSIAPEDNSATRYMTTADTIEEALDEAIDRVHAEVFLRKPLPRSVPWTNPDDSIEPPWLAMKGDAE